MAPILPLHRGSRGAGPRRSPPTWPLIPPPSCSRSSTSGCAGDRLVLDDVDEHLHRPRGDRGRRAERLGKSTLLRLLNRLEGPRRAGCCSRVDVRELDVLELRRRAVLVPQRAVALTDGVRSEVRLAAPALSDDDVDRLLARASRFSPADGFVDPRSRSLSGGEAAGMCLARALAVGPEVLLLDEPTSAST